jgi:glutaminase
VIDEVRDDESGQNADYISELRDAHSNHLAVCMSTSDGFVYGAGDVDVQFSIQSISKAFVYALALEEWGTDFVLGHVGVEPSGEAFNELTLDSDTHTPLNPMINAGAITTHALIGPPTLTSEERFERIRRGLSAFAGRDLTVDEAVYKSELDNAYRNMAIACMLKNYDVIVQEPDDVVRGYTRQCAINVSSRDLALMAATFSNGGIQPVTGRRIVRRDVVRQTLSVMMTCGMYNGAGHWVSSIGFPAKSGVAGGVIGVLPGQVGIATFSPRLDKNGNSVRGVQICKRLSDDMGLHIMNAPEPARGVIRREYVLRAPENSAHNHNGNRDIVGVLSIQGTINFSSAERVLRAINSRTVEHGISLNGIVLDVRSVYSIDAIARRLIREVARRTRRAGIHFTILDPDGLLGMDMGEVQPAAPPGARLDDKTCHIDDIIEDLSVFQGWEKVPLPETIKGFPQLDNMPHEITA